jgi:1-acyl-sn-glycerol-3-phosphate acyltransferase
VPVTITGAYDAWPSSRFAPLPRKITVKYHRPIVLDPAEVDVRRDDKAYHEEITERLRRAIERRLLPSLDADERKRRAFEAPASPVRIYELGPVVAALGAVALGGPAVPLLLPVALYFAYVVADIWWIPQGRLAKAARDLAAPAIAIAIGPTLARVARIETPEWASLAAVAFGFLAAFNWTNYYKGQRFVRGALFAYFASFALALWMPYPYAPHVAFASFALVYAVAWRPLFWVACALTAAAYLAGLVWAEGGPALPAAVHAGLGLAAAAYIRLVKFSAHDGRLI